MILLYIFICNYVFIMYFTFVYMCLLWFFCNLFYYGFILVNMCLLCFLTYNYTPKTQIPIQVQCLAQGHNN